MTKLQGESRSSRNGEGTSSEGKEKRFVERVPEKLAQGVIKERLGRGHAKSGIRKRGVDRREVC